MNYKNWIKAKNPNALCLFYRLFIGVYASSQGGCYDPWKEYPDFEVNDALLKDMTTGKPMTNKDFTSEYLVDPANQWYRDYLKNWCQTRIDNGFDGIWADMVRSWYPPPWHYGAARNPRTGMAYTDAEFAKDMRELVEYVGDIPIYANGFDQADGAYGVNKFKVNADVLMQKIEGWMIEGPLGWSASDFNSRNQAAYTSNLNLLQSWMKQYPSKHCMLMNHEISNVPFAFISFMLVVEGDNWSLKHGGKAVMESQQMQDFANADYGTPMEEYQVNGSVFSREYTKATFYADYSDRTAWIEYKQNGGESLSFVNETSKTVVVYKRPIVVDEMIGTVIAGGSIDVVIDESKEKLVIKDQ